MPGRLTRPSLRLKQKRLQFGHCYQADKEIISSLILRHSAGTVHSCKLTYPEVIARDSGFDSKDLRKVMASCGGWEEISMSCPVHSGDLRMMMMMMMMMNTFRFDFECSCLLKHG